MSDFPTSSSITVRTIAHILGQNQIMAQQQNSMVEDSIEHLSPTGTTLVANRRKPVVLHISPRVYPPYGPQ